MSAKRWLWIALVWVLSTTGVAHAQVSISADPVDAGSVSVNGMGSNSATLSSSENNVNVDIVMGTCGITTGSGMFMLSTSAGTLTNVNLNSSQTVTATYSPTTRGLRECTVNVYDTGTMNLRLSFKVRGTGVAPVISTTPASTYTFPAVRFNDAAIVHTSTVDLVITNTGDAGQDLVVNNITRVGGLAGDYAVAGPLPRTVAPGGSATFVITFDPVAAGPSSTTLQIDSNDPATPTKNISLDGIGTTGIISVTDITFATPVPVGTTASQNITVSNIGAGTRGALRVTQAAFVNNTDNWFKFNTAACPGTTTPCTLSFALTTGTASLPILCNPPTTAPPGAIRSATVVFTSDTDDASDSTATVTCTAARAEMVVDQTPLMFGDQLINTTSAAQTVSISNTGNATLSYSLSFIGGDFLTTGGTNCVSPFTACTLAAGAAVNISVAFRPGTVGAKSASLRVTAANDEDTPFLDVPLDGTGVAPVSTLNTAMLSFGNVDLGDTSTAQMLTVTNTGTYPLTINAAHLPTLAGQFPGDYTVTGTTGTSISIVVQPTDSASWMIACKPTAPNSRPATFRISSDHNGAATNQDVALSCNGLQGRLGLPSGATAFNFGGVRENETRDQAFTLRNNGNTTITNVMVAFTGTGTGYTLTTPTFPIASIAPGASIIVNARFAPLDGTYGGQYIATFTGTWGTGKTATTTLTLDGDGLTTGYDTVPASPNALDFGNVRFDQTKLMNVQIVNTAGTTVQLRGLSITPGTAFTGEFVIVRCLRNNIVITCPSATSPYNSSGVNDTIVVVVRVDPANRVAMLDATLTVTSDLPVNPNRTVPLKASSVTAAVGLDPMTMVLDFGPTDLDKVPVSVTRTVRITNTGNAQLDFSSVTKVGGPTGNVRFSFGPTPVPASLQPDGTYDIQVTYTPVIEKPANQPDTGSITIGGVSGAFGVPASITIQLRGHGIDRHIALAPVPTFPDTFTNPGDKAPVRPITVTNTGDATLSVSAVMLTNDPIWTVVNPDPVDIPGRGTHDFDVKFSPLMAGKAPVGRLTIINNDNGMPMAAVDLNGNGIARNIVLGSTDIDLGYAGIGMTVRLSDVSPVDMLSITNGITSCPTSDCNFPINGIEISGGNGAFEILTADGRPISLDDPLPLAMGATQKLEVLFTPNHEGDFVADARIFVDGDPQAVQLRGRGLYVDTRGGGGCSTGHGGGLATIAIVLAVMIGWRRRRACAVLVAVGSVGVARAEQTRNANPTVFDPTPAALTETTFHVQGASVADAGSYGVFALVSYANKPLIFDTAQNDHFTVENRTTLQLGGAYAFGALEIGARMPFYLQSGDPEPTMEERRERFGVAPGGTARGDLTAHGKLQIGARGGVAYGIAAAVTVPTATDGQYAGTELPTGRVLFLLSIAQGPIIATLNAGGIARAKAHVGSATQGSGGVWGAALSWRVRDKLWLAGEIFGELIPSGESTQPAPMEPVGAPVLGKPIEGLVGMHYRLARTTNLGVAFGRGVTSDMGSPAVRGVLTLSFTPSAHDLAPLHPPRPPEPDKDADTDAIKDELDSCPNEPEDKDLFDDDDGCPDADNDNDNIADATDKCPLDAEDKDRFQDDDGCPEKDNDSDGTPDAQDKCPMAAEDRDGFEDQDGCIDPDNDRDGLLDTVDKCPREQESINGNNDDDGCPDRGNSLVVVSPDRLELLESIQFNGAKVLKSSHNVLGQVGATLRAHPEILRVRLTAHVQPTNNAAQDRRLSEQRAKSVRDWLVDWGVDPLRLQASGFGGTKPLVPPTTKSAKEINDRIELIILERR